MGRTLRFSHSLCPEAPVAGTGARPLLVMLSLAKRWHIVSEHVQSTHAKLCILVLQLEKTIGRAAPLSNTSPKVDDS